MHKTFIAAAMTGLIGLTACTLTSEEQIVVGGLGGAALGIITAKTLTSDPDWVIIGALAGAAIGVIVARNDARGECAVSNGDGTYRLVRC